MKQLFIFFTLLGTLTLNAQDSFITKWTFLFPATQIRFNAETDSFAVEYTWIASPSGNSGSGSFTQAIPGQVTLSGLTIATGDVVTLTMTPIHLKRFYLNFGSDRLRLTDVAQWGDVPWTSMEGAFAGCSNLQISATDVPDLSKVTNMGSMFLGAQVFNQDIGSWNTDEVIDMNNMFYQAHAFNQDISNWKTSKVTNMLFMFFFAKAFNQDLGSWTLNAEVDLTNMLGESGMDCDNYSKTLVGWQANNPTVYNRSLGADGLHYGADALAARIALTTTQGWTITDAGLSDCFTSISIQDDSSQFNLFPNPSNGMLHITFPEAWFGQTLLLTNIMGEVFQSKIINNTLVDCDLENLSSGVYFIQVQTHNGMVTRKIIKH